MQLISYSAAPLVGVAALAAGTLAYAVRGRSSALFGPSVWRGPRHRKAVALTFDDGPSESTPELLEILRRYRVPATFFQCGMHVRRLPDVARMVAADGHEIGNHSDSHPGFVFRGSRFIHLELERAQQAIRGVTGRTPTLFRPPYGARWFGLARAQRRLGLLGVMWTTIGRDWTLPAPRIVDRILKGLENGAILCLHDARVARPNPDIRPTLEAVHRLLPEILARGFRLETVGDLIRHAE